MTLLTSCEFQFYWNEATAMKIAALWKTIVCWEIYHMT